MMLDWNQYREQLMKAIGDLGRLSPQTVRGYRELSDAGIAVQHQLDTVARRKPRTCKHRRDKWKLGLTHADRHAICGNSTYVADGDPSGEMQKADEGEGEDHYHERPTTNTAQ
jgi:hypothetical protein